MLCLLIYSTSSGVHRGETLAISVNFTHHSSSAFIVWTKIPSIQLPPRTLSIQLPPRTLSIQLPPRTLSIQLPPRTPAIQLPPRTLSIQLPPRTPSIQLPPRTPSIQLPPCCDIAQIFPIQNIVSYHRDVKGNAFLTSFYLRLKKTRAFWSKV